MKNKVKLLPAIHDLQTHSSFEQFQTLHQVEKEYLTSVLREVVAKIRNDIVHGKWDKQISSREEMMAFIFQEGEDELVNRTKYYLTKTINATGTVLHTNLGRARLSDQAIQHVVDISKGYSNLEYDISEGKRGSRHSIVESLLKELTGAESAMVVNNNAAAVFIVLRALAKNQEVIVSRGQLVEIGGSFRISAIMEESGARLVEVGTTNKTHLEDYENAITEETAMILKVHTSNFKTIGFTKTIEVSELVTLKNEKDNLVIYEDLGSGVLYDFKQRGIGDEPVIKEVLQQGVDLVSFSGDKLLGGPQAGIIVGKKELISQLKKHQLARVLRVDKMTYAALEATLFSYLKGRYSDIPTIRDIIVTKEKIMERCQLFRKCLLEQTNQFTIQLKEEGSPIGGGTMPGVEVPTHVVCLTHTKMSAEDVAVKLRQHSTPIIVRIKNNEVVLDFRTIEKEEINEIVKACTLIE
ncbi:L-seryl-tRNA(Sec) selenium transferase [Fredinandcohnia sp. QZ13]|uniref:L-seryl-tRNA(Sec) selenium transferase n=1 Tax=Fredinandcohnia sp. QZ13 TaxID=3073144 RepID=UPI0028536E86|nr:L-seryl-tRNA(Sec) selenium transferase [Fredinandcohnia sp. QZ13]MDR4886386.1 L-seryl-tRNA(Sec) selenium transferase [Fredinandcohnia sp. QZ13]